ncbi:MAG: hypothetical protein QW761_02910 [Candidatus Aenigmatarchaeota archaeon]
MPFRVRLFGVTNRTVLEALSDSNSSFDLEMLFIINDGDEEAEKFIREKAPQYLKTFKNIHVKKIGDSGYVVDNITRARNSALLFTREKGFNMLWFVDDDVAVMRNTLKLLNEAPGDIVFGIYDFRSSIELENVRNKPVRSVMKFLEYPPPKMISPLAPLSCFYPNTFEPFEADVGGGGCMLIRGEALYDEKLDFNIEDPFYNEDFNFSFKAKKLGYKLFAQPRAVCAHLPSPPKKVTMEEAAVLAAVEEALFYTLNRFFSFYSYFRRLPREVLENPRGDLPESLKNLRIPVALQIEARKYLLLAGKDSGVEVLVFTIPWPLPLREFFNIRKFYDIYENVFFRNRLIISQLKQRAT